MPSAVVNFIKDDEHAKFIEKPPESVIAMFHGLVCISAAHGTNKTVEPLIQYVGEGSAKFAHHLARRRKAEHKIDFSLFKEMASQSCRHTRFTGTGGSLTKKVWSLIEVSQCRLNAPVLPLAQFR